MVSNLITKIIERIYWCYLTLVDRIPGIERDFSWKVRWRIRNDKNPIFVVIQDKYEVKEFAKTRAVKTADTYFVTDKPDTIPFESLPSSYFLKANHGCKWNIYFNSGEFYLYGDGEDLIRNKNTSGNKISKSQAIDYCKNWLNRVYSKREWAYQKILPKIIIEEVLEQNGGGELLQYMCFAFNGKVKAIYVDSPSQSVNLQRIFVYPNWKEFDIINPKKKESYTLSKKPLKLDEMIKIAEILARDLDFIRVDLYDSTKGIVLGEISVYHNGGRPMVTLDKKFNKWLGDQWVLPK